MPTLPMPIYTNPSFLNQPRRAPPSPQSFFEQQYLLSRSRTQQTFPAARFSENRTTLATVYSASGSRSREAWALVGSEEGGVRVHEHLEPGEICRHCGVEESRRVLSQK